MLLRHRAEFQRLWCATLGRARTDLFASHHTQTLFYGKTASEHVSASPHQTGLYRAAPRDEGKEELCCSLALIVVRTLDQAPSVRFLTYL